VPIDATTFDRYQSLPPSPLQLLIIASVSPVPVREGASPAAAPASAVIRMNAQHHCPLLTAQGLCGIQAELGEALLSDTCATYPRIVHRHGAEVETALALSCPEAARLVLLSAPLYDSARPQSGLVPLNSSPPRLVSFDGAETPVPEEFWSLRTLILSLVQNRLYSLWQRLFLVGLFCRRLDALAASYPDCPVPEGKLSAAIAEFAAAVAQGHSLQSGVRASMEKMPADPQAQLDVVLRLAGLMLHKSNVRPRFVECVNAFTRGIGNGPHATLETLTAHYAAAHDRCFVPFIERNPNILENFLVNTIVRCQFPFGKAGMAAGARPDSTRQFSMLIAQFVLIRGLLIGVAGHHGSAFSADHVVHTVQSASKHFEHHPEFLAMAHTLLVESGMDGMRGMAVLLRDVQRNQLPARPAWGESMPASAEIPAPATPGGRSASARGPAGTARPQ
jgi:lysine-N-methylase